VSAEPFAVEPLESPPDADVVLPGSKSITNRALLVAALADGTSVIDGALFADDTAAMLDAIDRLGAVVVVDADAAVVEVTGTGGVLPPTAVDVDARQSGTTARFLLPVLALGSAPYHLDGHEQLRARPMAPAITALRSLDVTISEHGAPGCVPVTVQGPARGGRAAVSGDVSSQFLSGLLLSGPYLAGGLDVDVTTPLVSRPYVTMTTSVMRAFGAVVRDLAVDEGGYRACRFTVEPDASAASYFFAAAAICGGRVTVPGLGRRSLQGDLAFVDVLARMGARIEQDDEGTTVTGDGRLGGIDVDLADLSDTAPTLAVVAAFADSPTTVSGIGFIRRKETDRIAAVLRELRRCGIEAEERPDGFVVHPGTPRPAVIEPDDDHRLAMAFGVLGLRAPGIRIAQPECVGKTFPGFWVALDQLRSAG
jgi:3-phosphoshikimate 1-carboxyvinyltransferase